MTTILKQFGEWGISLRQNKFARATLRLTAYYVLSTFVILCVSSAIIYVLFNPSAPASLPAESRIEVEHDEFSVYEFREHLLSVLVVADAGVLLVVAVFAYFFAYRTLRPIEDVYLAQERFVADAAHELRTPLTAMKAGGESILRKDRTPEIYQVYIRESNEEVDRLTRLSNQLLFIAAQKSTPTSTPKSIVLPDLAKRVVRQYEAYAEEKGVKVYCVSEGGCLAKIHEDGAVQLLQNLIKNAIDYNRPGGEVVVSLREEDSWTILSIRDTGVGISKEALPFIFERFYKADSARKQGVASGTGLGLSIVQEIVTRAGGAIEVKSEAGQGTEMVVRIPRT